VEEECDRGDEQPKLLHPAQPSQPLRALGTHAHGSSSTGHDTNSASWFASTCFACTASADSSTRSASSSSATSLMSTEAGDEMFFSRME
jgi:hypothetical protein